MNIKNILIIGFVIGGSQLFGASAQTKQLVHTTQQVVQESDIPVALEKSSKKHHRRHSRHKCTPSCNRSARVGAAVGIVVSAAAKYVIASTFVGFAAGMGVAVFVTFAGMI